MEGLAAASGVFAVASFSIQLVETAQKISHFVKNVIGAPKEYRRLVDLLDLFKEILRSIENEEQNSHELTAFSGYINILLKRFSEKLKLLEGYIKSIEGVEKGKGHIRAYTAFKRAFKDNECHDLEEDLENILNLMGSVMTAEAKIGRKRNADRIIQKQKSNTDRIVSEVTDSVERIVRKQVDNTERIIGVHSSNTGNIITEQSSNTERIMGEQAERIINTITQNIAFQLDTRPIFKAGEASSPTDSNIESFNRNMSRSTYDLQVSRRQSTITSRYQSLLGTLYIRRTKITISTSQDNEEMIKKSALTQIKTGWAFFPAFLSRCVELQYQNSYGSTFRSLRTYQVIDDKDPIFNICYEGNSTELQNYFDNNRHRLSPFVVDSEGRGLLYYAALGQNSSTSTVLFHLRVEPNSTIDNDGYDPMRFLAPCSPRKKERSPENILRLFLSLYPDMLERGALGFWGKYNIDEFENVVERWVRRDNINLFDDSPIVCAIRSFSYSIFPFHVERYIKVTQKLVELGADLHRRSETTGLSLLHEILAEGNDPYESCKLYEFWTIVLYESHVDLNGYLDTELDFYRECSPIFIGDLDGRQRCITMAKDIHEQPSFSWDWWIDPQAPGFEVLNEFRLFGPPWHDLTMDMSDSGPQWKYNFPFLYYPADLPEEEPVQLPGAWVE